MGVTFCPQCSSLMYPRAWQDKNLHFDCRQCTHNLTSVDKRDQRVRMEELRSVIKEKQGQTYDVEADPTLMRSNMRCPSCMSNSAVKFQDQSNEVMRKSTSMILFYKCRQCGLTYRDPTSEEGPSKEMERQAREQRIAARAAKAASGKTAPAPAPAAAATAAPVMMDIKPDISNTNGNGSKPVLAAPGVQAHIAQSGTGNMSGIQQEDSDDDDY